MRQAASLQVDHVTHAFGGAPVLQDISTSIVGRSFVSLVGPSGCGKSTLLRMLAGLLAPSQGTVGTEDATVHGLPQAAFVFQDPTLLPWRTVTENVRLPLELAGEGSPSRVEAALKLVGLRSDDHHKFPRELSGGMRMRVSLARAIVTEPELLLLDEPFAALDDLLRQQLNEELLRLWPERNCTAVFVTHNVAEAVFLSQRVLVMSARPGRIVADIEVPFAYPRSPALRSEAGFATLVGSISERLRAGVAA